MTGVPPDHQKLVTAGAVLRDDLAPLSSFGLVDPVAPEADGEAASTPSFWDTWSFKSGKKSKPLKKVMMLGTKEVSGSVNDRLASRSDLKHVQEQEEQQAVEKPKDDEDTVVAKIAALVKGAMDEWGPKIVGLEAYLAQKTGTEAPLDPEADPVEAPVEVEKPNPRTAAWLSEGEHSSMLRELLSVRARLLFRLNLGTVGEDRALTRSASSPPAEPAQARLDRHPEHVHGRAEGAQGGRPTAAGVPRPRRRLHGRGGEALSDSRAAGRCARGVGRGQLPTTHREYILLDEQFTPLLLTRADWRSPQSLGWAAVAVAVFNARFRGLGIALKSPHPSSRRISKLTSPLDAWNGHDCAKGGAGRGLP